MAAQQYQADPETLRNEGEKFRDVGADFATAAKTLKSTLDGIGEPWGSDAIGGPFGEIYTPIKEGFDEAMPHLGGELKKIGSSLEKMADNYELTEDDTDKSIRTLGAQRPNISV